MTKHTFEAQLERPEGVGTWTMCPVPLDVEKTFGAKGQFKVKATMDGKAIRTTLMPRGDGTHYFVVNREIREAIQKQAGDTVRVTLEPDTEPRRVELPDDFARALKKNKAAFAAFEKMPYSHQRQYLEYIDEAKRAE